MANLLKLSGSVWTWLLFSAKVSRLARAEMPLPISVISLPDRSSVTKEARLKRLSGTLANLLALPLNVLKAGRALNAGRSVS